MEASPDIEILRRLREAGGGFITGGDVAARIEILRGAGYGIEHSPGLGYRLVSSPDRLIADDILSRLAGRGWIREVLVFEKTGSTNDVVAGMARDGAGAGMVLFAEEQTAGRGRMGREWKSDPRLGLWFSLLLRPRMPFAQWPRLTLWIARAVAAGIQGECPGLEIMLKWPNDLYASGRKVAGILVESCVGANAFAVAGIGINVNHPSFPAPLDGRATSLRIETGKRLDRNAMAAAVLGALDRCFLSIPGHFEDVVAWASEADWLRGRWVSAAIGRGGDVHEGVAQGLDPEGALLIRTAAGPVARVSSGEVTRFSANRG